MWRSIRSMEPLGNLPPQATCDMNRISSGCDMQRMTELEDFYDYTREPEKKQKYHEELTACWRERSHEPVRPATCSDVHLAQIEFKEEKSTFPCQPDFGGEIARRGTALGVARQANRSFAAVPVTDGR